MATAPQAQNIALILGGGLVPPSLSSLGNYVAASACYSQLSADCVVGASGVPVHLSIASKSVLAGTNVGICQSLDWNRMEFLRHPHFLSPDKARFPIFSIRSKPVPHGDIIVCW
jgi:hypothetical protein